MTITVTNLFCGAGGSSLGAESAGLTLRMAANHWQTAIDVHQAHFPDAGHDCADISQADPRRYPVTDILLASPECTNHSQARGVSRKRQDPSLWDAPDPAAERSRATMWDVPRFAEQMNYSAIVVENVVEAAKWVGWRGWCVTMNDLGYTARVLSHNSQDHGVAQSRDRIYVVWTKDGLTVDLEMERSAWCPRCDAATVVRQAWKNGRTVGRYRQQWEWRCITCGTACEVDRVPAAEIIDWSLDCPRIGDRARPLADKTRARIAAGLERYGWLEPVVDRRRRQRLRNHTGQPGTVHVGLATQTTTLQHALAEPPGFLMNTAHGGRVSDVRAPHPTVCASDDRQSLIVPLRNNGNAYPTTDPLGTVAANGNHHGLLMRNNTAKGDQGQMVTPTSEPARTMTTAGHQSLLMPYYGQSIPHPTNRPVGTVTTRDRHALIDAQQAVDDCGFRMLEPHEVAAAMAFPDGYIPSDLTKKDRVKLAGNAVTPPVMQWICGRIAQAMEAS